MTVFNALLDAVDLKELAKLAPEAVREELTDIISEIVNIKRFVLSASEQQRLVSDICNDILGLGPLATSPDQSAMGALVLGYPGQDGANTSLQEVAHAMGRYHAPCGGAQQIDPTWPSSAGYSDAKIGVWGYDILGKQWINPATQYRDIMSYCNPYWISDYTYMALSNRIQFVNKTAKPHPKMARGGAPVQTTAYRFVTINADGSTKWGRSVSLTETPSGDARTVSFVGANGAEIATATGYYRQNAFSVRGTAPASLGGGTLLVPEAPASATSVRITGLTGLRGLEPIATRTVTATIAR